MGAAAAEEQSRDLKLPSGFRNSEPLEASDPPNNSLPTLDQIRIKTVKTADLDKILGADFINHEDIARILSRAMRTGKNVILWGPPGHAKSAMVIKALEGLKLKDSTFVLDFGEGMDEPTLWGGLNFKRLHEDHILDFNPERSFLNYPVVVFEELFDAPPQVLCALKNSLTAKCLYKSDSPFPMKTQVIIACTNKSPAEIAALGESARALIERFPLQLKVEWPDYSAQSYAEMFAKIGFADSQFNSVFADIVAEAGKKGAPISPRTAMHAYQIVADSSLERGIQTPDAEALSYLQYVPGLEKIGKNKAQEYADQLFREEAQRSIESAINIIEEIKEEIDVIADAQKLLEKVADLSLEEESLAQLKYPKELKSEYDKALQQIQSLTEELTKKATKVAAHSRKSNLGAV